MMSGVLLVNTSLVAVGSSVTDPQQWRGGEAVLVITATQFAPVITLCLAGVGQSNVALRVNSTALQANLVTDRMFLPQGKYQVHSAGGTSIGLYAAICGV